VTPPANLSTACQITADPLCSTPLRTIAPSICDDIASKGLPLMNLYVYLTQQPDRLDLTEPDALSCLISAVHGAGDRGGVGAGLRLALRLDTDPRTDPLNHPTPQASAPNSSPQIIQITQQDPSWGLPRRGVDEYIQ
jgi:hypothetical protein